MKDIFNELYETVKDFPAYALGWTVGLVIAILRDVHVTTLVVTGVFVGLLFGSILSGVSVFFILYSLSRTLSNISDSIGFGLNRLSGSIRNGA